MGFAGAGLGDRHQQNGVNYTLDLNTGLTQVLGDGTNTYLYGNGRIAQAGSTTEYFLGDALGSVRQLTDLASVVTLTQSYAPYGETVSSVGGGTSAYQYTGEMRDASGLTYLRARYYAPQDGRFISRDIWSGDTKTPITYNRWIYANADSINNVDPSGFCSQGGWNAPPGDLFSNAQCNKLEQTYLDVTRWGKTDGLQEMQDWYYRLADRLDADGRNQPAINLRHFLSGTGENLELSDTFIENYIWGWDYANKKVEELANWYIRTQVSSCNPLAVVGPDGFATGIDVTLNNFDMWNPGNWPEPDAYGSLGSFRLDAVFTGEINRPWSWPVSKAYTVANLNIRLVVMDYYNWHSDQSITYSGPVFGNEVPDDWAKLLKDHGYGQNFWIVGDSDVSYKKKLGPVRERNVNEPPEGWYNASCVGVEFLPECLP